MTNQAIEWADRCSHIEEVATVTETIRVVAVLRSSAAKYDRYGDHDVRDALLAEAEAIEPGPTVEQL